MKALHFNIVHNSLYNTFYRYVEVQNYKPYFNDAGRRKWWIFHLPGCVTMKRTQTCKACKNLIT